jgi:wyosine [tRNA(Phe)-imidazoG37] synthetase (radical SAM superfamily)
MDNRWPVKIVSTQKKEILEIIWTPSNVCNFNCRYCFPGANLGDHKSPPDVNLIIKNFNHMLQKYKEKIGKTQVHFKISGGEPSLWKDLDKFIEGIKENNDVYLSLITNGSRTLRWWQKKGNLIDNVTLSFHAGEADVDHHIAVADIMYELGKKTTVLVLMDPTNWDKCIEKIEYMKEHSKYNWFIQVAEVIEPDHVFAGHTKEVDNHERLYTPEQKEFMKNSLKRMPGLRWFVDNYYLFKKEIRVFESIATLNDGTEESARPHYYINNNWNKFLNWSCDIGLELVFINWDGEIRGSCGQKLYGNKWSYNILDADFADKFDPEFKSVICSINNCFCQTDTHVTKHKI